MLFYLYPQSNRVSLPFIRNHNFARNSTKGLIFKAFWLFPDRLIRRLKKKTVNLSIKNEILRLRFGWVHFILTNHFCVGCLFFDYRDAIIERRVVQCRGCGPWGHNQTKHYYRVGSSIPPQLFFDFIGWDFGSHPIILHLRTRTEGRIQPSTTHRVGSSMIRHRAR